jgi:hypothetical protein
VREANYRPLVFKSGIPKFCHAHTLSRALVVLVLVVPDPLCFDYDGNASELLYHLHTTMFLLGTAPTRDMFWRILRFQNEVKCSFEEHW